MITNWRKSARSEGHGNCVELAALPGKVAIRDSKACEAGHLALDRAAFADLLARVKRDEFVR
ncbi:hypothetical protein GCM10010182_16220 [Actinomadura cremea]|nr:hypothetical protein GCM10010182_16220 [Actinomadura cremea]